MKVFLVAESKINQSELNSFMNEYTTLMGENDPDSTAFIHAQRICSSSDRTENGFSDADILSEVAGRLCYMSFGSGRKTNEEYLEHIKEVGHLSVTEHTQYTFIITGVSRSLTHELVRHRHLSPSQLSQRYVDESNVEFVTPPLIKQISEDQESGSYRPEFIEDDEKNLLIRDTIQKEYDGLTLEDIFKYECMNIRDKYIALNRKLEDYLVNKKGLSKQEARKQAREAARGILPNATETRIMMTGNARAWRHFIDLRASLGADAEICMLAVQICKILQEASPNLFSDYTILTKGTREYAVSI